MGGGKKSKFTNSEPKGEKEQARPEDQEESYRKVKKKGLRLAQMLEGEKQGRLSGGVQGLQSKEKIRERVGKK